MALINRISRLFKADFNAVLDQIEEPEALLKQAMRDMEDELAASERRITLSTLDLETLALRKSEMEDAIADLDSELDLCFQSGKDDLARGQIKRKLEAERLLKRLNARHAADEQTLADQKSTFDENSATLESLRQKAELFAHRAPVRNEENSEYDDVAWMAREMNVSDDEIEIAFLREKDARSSS